MSNRNSRSFSQQLFEARAYFGLTQDEVSSIVGVARGTLSHLERGTRNSPSPEVSTRLNTFVSVANILANR
jgi:DNA-binding XRE family transcriptional regulator